LKSSKKRIWASRKEVLEIMKRKYPQKIRNVEEKAAAE
jgi:hypothetical protein